MRVKRTSKRLKEVKNSYLLILIEEHSARDLKKRLIDQFKRGEESALRQAPKDFNEFSMKMDKTGNMRGPSGSRNSSKSWENLIKPRRREL